MFKKILVATDFSRPSKAALVTGLELAQKSEAEVHVVHVITYVEDIYNVGRFLIPADLHGELRKQLDDFFPPNLYPKNVRKTLVGPRVAEELLKYAQEETCDLIVVGTHGRGPLGRLLLGSVAQQLARTSKVPVMIVRSDEHHEKEPHRVLIPSDFSETSLRALDFAVQFANFLKADLHVIHVVDLPMLRQYSRDYPFIEVTGEPSNMNVDDALESLLQDKQIEGNVEVNSIVGTPVHEILAYAQKEKITFIVMGTHGRRGLERLLLGSVTAGVTSKTEVPVITISQPQD